MDYLSIGYLQNYERYQKSLYNKNFYEFSKSVCDDTFGKTSSDPTFSKAAADNFYQNRYQKETPVDHSKLKWFPDLIMPESFSKFKMDPFKPKDIKNLIKSKSNSSSPGPDGIPYAILKKLPCTHHILATLYSKLLITPIPPQPDYSDLQERRY